MTSGAMFCASFFHSLSIISSDRMIKISAVWQGREERKKSIKTKTKNQQVEKLEITSAQVKKRPHFIFFYIFVKKYDIIILHWKSWLEKLIWIPIISVVSLKKIKDGKSTFFWSKFQCTIKQISSSHTALIIEKIAQ